MLRQASFSDLEYANKKRRTRRDTFLPRWTRWFRGRSCWGWWNRTIRGLEGAVVPPVGLASMLRIYFLQQWFALSDRQMEDGLYDIESLRRFAGFSNVTKYK
jgi:IS5 family transposase